jgi:uncharacterized protein YjbI with pentapeptide repeats/lipoprotein-anchoring transpeptidase ErfK/SrfK
MSSQTKRRRVAGRGSVCVTMASGVASRTHHADILRRGPSAWNAWRKRNPNIVPDLAGVALELDERRLGPADGGPIDLHAASLPRVVFCFAVLSGGNLDSADLTGADLAHSHLHGANLSGVSATQARLDHADLTAARLSGGDFCHASLRFVNLSGADLETANLAGSDLVHGRLSGANLSGANLSKARLDHADFDAADLTNANLSGASLHHVKNLSAGQLASARGSRTTVLPPELQGKVPWSVRKDPASAVSLEPHEPSLAQPGPAARVEAFDAARHVRPVFLIGALSAIAIVGLGLAGDQLRGGILPGVVVRTPAVEQQVAATPVSASATPDVAPARARAPTGDVTVPPDEPAALATVPPASVDPGPAEERAAPAPAAVEEAVEPQQDLVADLPVPTGAATLPVRPAVLVVAAILPGGARLEVGIHGARPEATGEATVRSALDAEPLRLATASHAVAAIETSPRFDRPALSVSVSAPSLASHGTALEARTGLAVVPALALAEPDSSSAGHGVSVRYASRAPVPPALTATEYTAMAPHAVPGASQEAAIPPALISTEHSAIASHAIADALHLEEARVPPALTAAEPFLAPHGAEDVAGAVMHAVAEAILAPTRHGFGPAETEALPTPHALGADDVRPSPHERPQPAPMATALLAPAVFEVSTPPAIAKKERAAKAKAEAPAVAAGTEPLTLVVSLNEQNIDVYRGMVLLTSAKVSSGMPGHETRTGVFSILEKRRYHRSNLYSGAPMPWMQRLTRSGTALHAGVVPGYPASHGCVRLPFSFAPKLFEMTAVGGNVVVAGARLEPEPIDHPKLFQPLARPAPQVAGNDRAALPDAKGFPAPERAAPYVILASQGGGRFLLGVRHEPQTLSAEVEWGEPHAISLWENIEPGSHAVAPALAALNSASDHAVVVTTSQAPLRMLITRRTARHRLIGAQYLLSSLGFLAPQKFDGTFGKATVAAIMAFQQAHDLPVNVALTDDLISAVYKAAGKEEPPEWHLFVRQNFSSLFDVPVTVRDPERPLGTHIFTAMRFAPGDAKVQWTEIDLEGGNGARALDRLDIPSDARRRIAARLTPGSALIIGDTSVDSAILPEGDDFLVWTKETPEVPKSKTARADDAEQVKTPKIRPKLKTSRPAPAIAKPRAKRENRVGRNRQRAPTGYSYQPRRFGRSGRFSSW